MEIFNPQVNPSGLDISNCNPNKCQSNTITITNNWINKEVNTNQSNEALYKFILLYILWIWILVQYNMHVFGIEIALLTKNRPTFYLFKDTKNKNIHILHCRNSYIKCSYRRYRS
eukprot:422269_1